MRYCLFSGMLALFVVTMTEAQDPKGKPKEPDKSNLVTEVAGKSFADWAKEVKSKDPSKREEAYRMILHFGPEQAYKVAPDILGDLKRHTTFTPVDLSVRVNGTMAISTIFKHMHMKDKKIDKKDMDAAVAVFTSALSDPQVVMRVRTVQALPWLGGETRNDNTVKKVTTMIRDTATWEARQAAIQTIAVLAFEPKKAPAATVMTALYTSADEKTESSALVRHAAVQAIGGLGASSGATPLERSGIVAKLYVPLEDTSPTVRYAAVQAIAAIGVATTPIDKPKIITRLSAKLDDKELPVRYATVQAITHLGARGAKAEKDHAITKLQPALRDSGPTVQMIGHVGIMFVRDVIAKDHIDPLCKFVEQKGEAATRIAALQHIGMLGTKGTPAIPCVLKTCRDKDLDVAGAAMSTLVQMKAYGAMDELKKIQDDKTAPEELREGAEQAIDDLMYVKKMDEELEKKKKDKK